MTDARRPRFGVESAPGPSLQEVSDRVYHHRPPLYNLADERAMRIIESNLAAVAAEQISTTPFNGGWCRPLLTGNATGHHPR